MFDPGNWFWRGIERFCDVVGLSVCWLLCSLPLFTMGAATAALYDSAAHCVRGDEKGTYVRFFRSFRDNFKAATPLTLLLLALVALGCLLWRTAYLAAAGGSQIAGPLLAAYPVLLCPPFGIWLLGMLTLSRFQFGWKDLPGTAAKLFFAHLPSGILMTAIAVAVILFTAWMLWFILFAPGVIALLLTGPAERIFKPFLEGSPPERE